MKHVVMLKTRAYTNLDAKSIRKMKTASMTSKSSKKSYLTSLVLYYYTQYYQKLFSFHFINFSFFHPRDNTRSSRISLRSTKSSTTLIHEDAPPVDPLELTAAAENLETNLEPQQDESTNEEEETNGNSDNDEE